MTIIAESYAADVLFIFCPAIISFAQFEIMMTYSIFATKKNIHAAVFVRGCGNLLKQFQKNNIE